MLSLAEIRKIGELLQQKGWSPTTKIFHHRNLSLLDAVSNFVARIKPELREIVFELLRHYEVINEYHQYGRSLCDRLIAEIDPSKHYYIAPLTLADAGRIKSGHNFCYDIISFFPRRTHTNVHFVDSPLSGDIVLNDNVVVIFTDDFVGTGDQFFEMYDEFVRRIGKPKLCILLVIRLQDEALEALSNAGIEVLYDQVRAKAISSGRATGAMSVQQALDSYLKIENEVKVPWGCSFGYGQSEAIVTMKRTPDNTLPIFWVDEDAGGQEWPAPFPRN